MKVDEITLTLPADDAFHGVAHLVLGGLAVRLNLTYELLEDLELCLDALLEEFPPGGDDLSVRVRIDDDDLTLSVGPFPAGHMRAELETATTGDALGLHRILHTVCDRVEVVGREGAERVEVTKAIERTEAPA
jgi:hypothetical protein